MIDKRYSQNSTVPPYALKKISGGRLNGMSDISPQWRIQSLTEIYGLCGIGWKVEIVERWVDEYDVQKSANTMVNLYVKDGDQWSEPIPGVGGSMIVAKENNGMYFTDEAWKMSYTDALSVCCKLVGIASDVYLNLNDSKNAKKQTESEWPKEIQDIWLDFEDYCYSKNVTTDRVKARVLKDPADAVKKVMEWKNV